MTPNELLWDGILRHLAQLVQEWTLLKVDVEAVAEADLLLAIETRWVDSEWVLHLSAALLEACQDGLASLLSKLHGLEGLLYFFLLGGDLLERVGLPSFI